VGCLSITACAWLSGAVCDGQHHPSMIIGAHVCQNVELLRLKHEVVVLAILRCICVSLFHLEVVKRTASWVGNTAA
jgi:hypothetical protein